MEDPGILKAYWRCKSVLSWLHLSLFPTLKVHTVAREVALALSASVSVTPSRARQNTLYQHLHMAMGGKEYAGSDAVLSSVFCMVRCRVYITGSVV
jgi:hypothetical protein